MAFYLAYSAALLLGVPSRGTRMMYSLSSKEVTSQNTDMSPVLFASAYRQGARTRSAEPYYRGCTGEQYDGAYKNVCKGMSNNGWVCVPRVLNVSGTGNQENNPNDNRLCPSYVTCSCSQTDLAVQSYSARQCRALVQMDVTQTEYHEIIAANICPSFIEACEEECDSAWTSSTAKCKATSCTVKACLHDFPSYKVDFFDVYRERNDLGCWGRLKAVGREGRSVFSVIDNYKALSKCCYRLEQGTDSTGTPTFQWMSGNELVNSWRPGKLLKGTKACDKKSGWHSAKHLGISFKNTKEGCEELAVKYVSANKGS